MYSEWVEWIHTIVYHFGGSARAPRILARSCVGHARQPVPIRWRKHVDADWQYDRRPYWFAAADLNLATVQLSLQIRPIQRGGDRLLVRWQQRTACDRYMQPLPRTGLRPQLDCEAVVQCGEFAAGEFLIHQWRTLQPNRQSGRQQGQIFILIDDPAIVMQQHLEGISRAGGRAMQRHLLIT